MYWPCSVPQVSAYHGPRPGIEVTSAGKGAIRVNETQGAPDNTGSNGDGDGDGDGDADGPANVILDLQTARNDHLFATITASRLDLWCTRPVVLLASLSRSPKSLESYGDNVSVVFKPDSSTIVLRTTESYLIVYSVESDQTARALQQQYGYSQAKRQNLMRSFGVDDTVGISEVLLRFRRAIKIDAGINSVVALDSELVVATTKPAAVQCIRWDPSKDGSHAVAQLLSKMDWNNQKSAISTMVHDRAMNLSVWLSQDGHAYAVQRIRPQLARSVSSDDSVPSSRSSTTAATRLFDGYCFHKPDTLGEARLTSINARFSLIAIATSAGEIVCYAAKDYVGNIPLSHTFKPPTSPSSRGAVTCLTWSPDGHCLFAGYEHGWSMWSVFGKEGASTFHMNVSHAESNNEKWLLAVHRARWISGGAEILITSPGEDRIWKLEMSRSAAVGCFSCANLVRALLQTPTELTVYRGHELPDLTSISNEASLWHHAQYPSIYLHNQWPVKSCVVSQDGRYVAIAGRRGLAHYSLQSGRWKTFSDLAVENSFAVRGGMCWFNHILAAATENAAGYDLRLYSRELELGRFPLHTEAFSMPIVFVGPSGEDSLLVYTYENILYHYILNITPRGAQLVQVGQIAFHGIVRAPSRVRSVSWVLPDSQLRSGDPSRDVEYASVLFLVDDKLVLLQSTRNEQDELKYDMRVIAQHVEYYILMRDQIYFNFTGPEESAPPTPSPGSAFTMRSQHQYSLRDSLWIFSGDELRLWPDVRDLFNHAAEGDLSTSPLLSMSVDFYPLSILLTKGVVLGIESELLQRRDVNFAQFRSGIRTQLFLPYILQHQLCEAKDTAAAFGLANQYQHLSYFPHALEILLHHVLDDEVDRTRKAKLHEDDDDSGDGEPTPGPLPAVLSFLQLVLPPTTYLSTVVQCIRKTELSSWRTLFVHLPPPLGLFEQALELEDLKTATGFLIVLQGLEEDDESDTYDARKFEGHVVRLMKLARQKSDFELCSELARFMMGIDPRGDALRRVIVGVGFGGKPITHLHPHRSVLGPSPGLLNTALTQNRRLESSPEGGGSTPSSLSGGDYFSSSPGGG
ncbi:hypothetical protein A1O3_05893 [Capronia epimyces CBS 606.96]|uniref:RIC1 C-terminal alpha solenoid region domain-containing protein n=1 Tax=Capronia epimyces CBS 606.96 TaxID=1182542 RepID=W9XY84_9EURO|nr:uncharacterized protein A1O3_05893 [Capronia epimyces CBS 606.96]EXJ85218.1 hypothetical protein A1O3_05893 [Capronia epimyces CBS 606.96]